jgi:hypothetical protein
MSSFAKRLFGGKNASTSPAHAGGKNAATPPAYTGLPPHFTWSGEGTRGVIAAHDEHAGASGLSPEALWFSDSAGASPAPAPAGAAGGGGGLGLGGRGTFGTGAPRDTALRLEQERLREQRESEQLEQALRVSQEMAQQEEASRADAEARTQARQAGAATAGAHGLFAGMHVGASPHVVGALAGAAVPSSIYSVGPAASSTPAYDGSFAPSFQQPEAAAYTPAASQTPADGGTSSAFSFMQSSFLQDGEAAEDGAGSSEGAGARGLFPSKQTMEPSGAYPDPNSMVLPPPCGWLSV